MNRTTRAPFTDRAILAALALTALARAAATFAPTGWWWGLDTFRALPAALGLTLAAVSLAVFVPAVNRPVTAALERLGRAMERGGLAADLALAAAAAFLCFALRDPLRFTGDSMMRHGLIDIPDASAGRLLRYYFPADVFLNFRVPRALMGSGLGPDLGLQLVGSIVGAAYALVSLRLLRSLGARGTVLAALALVLLAGPPMVHFAGYDKFGPLMLGTALATWGAVRVAREGRGWIALTAGATIAVVAHRSGDFLLPAVGWMAWRSMRSSRDATGRVVPLLAAAVVALAAAVMLPRTIEIARDLDLATHLPGSAVARSREAAGSSPALGNAAHVVNVIALLVPLGLAMLVAAMGVARGRRPAATPAPRGHGGLGVAALLALGGYGAIVATIAPGGGWPRDWDVALAFASLASLAGAGALVAAWGAHPRPPAAAVAAALALTSGVAFWTLHADEAAALRRTNALLAERSMWSAATLANAWDVLGARELNAGRFEMAAADFARAIENAPNPRYFHQEGLAWLAAGRPREAEASFRGSIARNPRTVVPWIGLARAALLRGDTLAAVAAADSALALAPANAEARAIRALAPAPAAPAPATRTTATPAPARAGFP